MAEWLEPRTSIPEVPGSSPGPAVLGQGALSSLPGLELFIFMTDRISTVFLDQYSQVLVWSSNVKHITNEDYYYFLNSNVEV